MKRLKLIDSFGREIDLNDATSQFMHDVTGLGVLFSNVYSNVADGFFPTSYRRISQGAVAGSIAFRSNTAYRNFINFIAEADELKFGYAPAGTWFFARCSVTKMAKADSAALDCAVEFKLLSPWAKQTPVRKSITADGEVLTYPKRYAFTYGKASAEAAAEFNIAGNMSGAYELTISGAVRNPDIKLYKYDDGWKMYGRCYIQHEMGAEDVLVLSTVPGKECVDLNGEDATAMLNITDNVFARPVAGKNKIVIESDSAITASAIINIYDYYYSV